MIGLSAKHMMKAKNTEVDKMLRGFSKRKSKYESAMNLIYDRNIHTLRNKVKILIVDDEDFDLIDILRERKYNIYCKRDISYAIEAEPFDIVVIDIKGVAKALGSGMEGFAIAKEIKTRYPSKQVWCYSGSLIKPEVSEKLKEIDGYIQKDTELDKWAEKLDGIIERYCSNEYQEEVLVGQLRRYQVSEPEITKILAEYKIGLEMKNFNGVTEMLPQLISSGKCVIEIVNLIYSFAKLFAAS